MIRRKKLLPVWLLILADVLFIAAYVLGFYGLYYLTPRQLNSSGIRAQVQAAEASQDNTLVAANTSDQGSSTGAGVTSSAAGTTDISEDSGTTADSDIFTSDSETLTADSENLTSDSETLTTDSENLAEKFAEHFTDTVITTDHSYSSKDISITVDQYTQDSGSNLVTYYVADIYVADIKSLQSGFAGNTYGVGYTESVLDMDSEFGSLLTINGDYYGNGGNGVVIRNGEVYRNSTNGSDVCVIYYNGVMKTYSAQEFDIDQAIKDGAWQAWSFGPGLLDQDGNCKTEFTADGHVMEINPRSAIGYYEPGHYCLVVVDGRQRGYSSGMNLTQLSELFQELGCKAAYNLDGGKSSVMAFNDSLVNQPTQGGREVSDCILIKETE